MVANYNVGPHLEMCPDLLRDPQAATTQSSLLTDPRLSRSNELPNALIRGSHVTRHKSPLLMGGRSEATGGTLGREVRSTTSQLDGDEHESGAGLSSIPEGEDGPPLLNATESEGSALHELAQEAAEMKGLTSPV